MQVRQDVLQHKHNAAGVGDSVLLELGVSEFRFGDPENAAKTRSHSLFSGIVALFSAY